MFERDSLDGPERRVGKYQGQLGHGEWVVAADRADDGARLAHYLRLSRCYEAPRQRLVSGALRALFASSAERESVPYRSWQQNFSFGVTMNFGNVAVGMKWMRRVLGAITVSGVKAGRGRRGSLNGTRAILALTLTASAMQLAAQSSEQSPAGSHSLRGVVFDSVRGTPLADALVQISATNDRAYAMSARSNARGEFVIDSLRSGSYLIGFLHPRLDSLLLVPSLRPVDIGGTSTQVIALAIPSEATLVTTFCGANAASPIVMLGRLRSTDASGERADASIRAEWSDLTMTAQSISTSPRSATARAGQDGTFALCGLPPEVRLYLRATVGRDSSPALAIDAPSSGLMLQSIWVSPLESSARAVMRGTVRSAEQKPIAGARLSVRGNASTATSDASGAFELRASPLGTRMLDIEAAGFQAQRIPINILGGDIAPLNIELSPHLPTLAPVRVIARTSAIDERRRKHVASFLDDSTIARRRFDNIGNAVRGMPGVMLINSVAARGTFSERRSFAFRATDQGTFGDRIVLGTPRKSCEPTVFVDGVRQFTNTTGEVDALADVQEIRTIELYRWGWEVPKQFDAPTECGALLIWRK